MSHMNETWHTHQGASVSSIANTAAEIEAAAHNQVHICDMIHPLSYHHVMSCMRHDSFMRVT